LRNAAVLFYTIHDLFQLEGELKARGVESKPIPTPREFSSDCGSALLFESADVETVRAAVTDLALEIQGIHELDE
jgi:hypothetical protein